jgi:hypothetical protein
MMALLSFAYVEFDSAVLARLNQLALQLEPVHSSVWSAEEPVK